MIIRKERCNCGHSNFTLIIKSLKNTVAFWIKTYLTVFSAGKSRETTAWAVLAKKFTYSVAHVSKKELGCPFYKKDSTHTPSENSALKTK